MGLSLQLDTQSGSKALEDAKELGNVGNAAKAMKVPSDSTLVV